MPDSFSELRPAGGSNRPWVIAGVLALAIALIGVAAAAGYRFAHPRQELLLGDASPVGPYSGSLTPADGAAEPQPWPVTAVFGGSTATVTLTETGCTAYFDASLRSVPLTDACASTIGDGSWRLEEPERGTVLMAYVEDGIVVAEGELTSGLQK